MSLKQALDDFKQTLATSKLNPIDGDPRTFSGRQMLYNQARTALPSKTQKVLELLKNSSYVLFVSGAGSEQVVVFGKQNAESIHVDVSKIYDEVAATVEATIPRSRQFGQSSFFVLQDAVDSAMYAVGLSPREMNFIDTLVVSSKEDTKKLVVSYINKFVGDAFVTAAIAREVVEAALQITGESSLVPVFVTGVEPEVAEKIGQNVLGGKYSLFEAKEDVSEKDVLKFFGEIKKLFKKQKDN